MELIFTFLLVAVLEAVEKNDKTEETPEVETFDLCVGCDVEKEEKEKKQQEPEIKIDIVIDPVTGKIRYIIKEIPLE